MANKKLSALITIGGTVAASFKNALTSTRGQLDGLGKSIASLSKKQRLLGQSINTFGKLGKNVDGLRASYAGVTAEIDRLTKAQLRLNKIHARSEKMREASAKMTGAGIGASMAGAGLLAPIFSGVKESKHYDTEKARIVALGMGEETNKKAFEFASTMKTFGTSQLENLELLRDGMSVFADLHHAEMVAPMLSKMKFANKAMFGSERGEQNTAQFMDMLKVIETRGGLTSEEAFNKQANIIQQVISATGGRVSASEWKNLIATGGLAAKGMSDEGLYYTMEHLVQEQGGDKVGTGLSALYSSLYQGRTTKRAAMNLDKYGLIGDESKVKHDKAGQVSYLDPGALKGGQQLRDNPFQWMENTLLPALEAKGVTSKDEILDVIGSIVSNKKGADLLAAMYMQREQIHKSEKLNRGAHNIDQLDSEARGTASGKEINLEAKFADLKLKVGTQILPLYIRGLELASGALERLNSFVQKNPMLSKAMIVGVTAIGASLATLGPILVTTAAGMYVFSHIAEAGLFVRIASGISSLIPPVLALGAALMATPIGWIVAGLAAVAVAGVMIYKYWEPLKAFFCGVFEGIAESLRPFIEIYSQVFEPIGRWVRQAVGWFGDLIKPIDEMSSTTRAFGETGVSVGKMVGFAFTTMLQPILLAIEAYKKIKGLFGNGSPSMEAPKAGGEYDINGNPMGGLTNALKPPAANNNAAPPLPSMPWDRFNPAPVTVNNDIKITQQPGQDSKALAKEVAAEITRQNAVNARRQMYDGAGGR